MDVIYSTILLDTHGGAIRDLASQMLSHLRAATGNHLHAVAAICVNVVALLACQHVPLSRWEFCQLTCIVE